jgi:hypothetical protein
MYVKRKKRVKGVLGGLVGEANVGGKGLEMSSTNEVPSSEPRLQGPTRDDCTQSPVVTPISTLDEKHRVHIGMQAAAVTLEISVLGADSQELTVISPRATRFHWAHSFLMQQGRPVVDLVEKNEWRMIQISAKPESAQARLKGCDLVLKASGQPLPPLGVSH